MEIIIALNTNTTKLKPKMAHQVKDTNEINKRVSCFNLIKLSLKVELELFDLWELVTASGEYIYTGRVAGCWGVYAKSRDRHYLEFALYSLPSCSPMI